ncbi:hypothetical protein D3C85_666740 [compost metagenome]
MILHALPNLHMPGNKVAGAGMTKHAAAVHAQIVQRVRHPMFAQIGGGGADDELQGKQAACDQPVLRREPDPKAHIDSLLYPVADTVIELHIRLDLGVEPAVLVQHWADDHLRDRAWPHDPQWAGECFPGLPRGRQGLLQAEQGGLGCLQKTLALFGQRHAAGGAMEQPHPEIGLQLPQCLAGGLRGDLLGLGCLAEAAQFHRAHEGGDGSQFADHGLSRRFTSFSCN